jgi:hypothetical protein
MSYYGQGPGSQPGMPPTGAYPGWAPQPPTQPKGVRPGWLIGAIIITAIVVGASAGSVGFYIGEHKTQIAAMVRHGSVLNGGCRTQTPAQTSQLTSRLLPLPTGAGKDGTLPKTQDLSLSQFVGALYSASQNQGPVLTALCFEAAARRAWLLPSGQITVIYLVQFGDAAQAQSWILRTIDGDSKLPKISGSTTVHGVTDGTILYQSSLDQAGNTLCHVLGLNGDVAILIHVYNPGHLPALGRVARVLRAQDARL